MAMQQVEYGFPEPDAKETAAEVEVKSQEKDDDNLEIEGAVGREEMQKPQKKQEDSEKIQAGEVEIEIEDDTPPADRGKKSSEPPEEVTNEELENYSQKVKKRIQHFSKSYHDERRAKETALREREALEQYAKQLIEENQKLKGAETKNHNALIESARKQVEAEMVNAKRMYKEAYDAGDSDAIIAAQEALNRAQIRADKLNNVRPREEQPKVRETSLQTSVNPVQQQEETPRAPEVKRDEKAEAWRDDNPWFGSDDEMTAFALGLHNKLLKDGVDPRSDEYYEKINSRMRTIFPEQFDDGIEDEPETAPKKRPSNVVAPATRSTGPKKVRLKQSEVAIAKKLGVPLDEYALQAAILRGNANG
jgi:hypothetical protein